MIRHTFEFERGGITVVCPELVDHHLLQRRLQNEAYLANRFPSGRFAMLLRVPVINGEAVAG
jgi:hypothetical protein